MTDKELKKLKRAELMELLYYMRREIDRPHRGKSTSSGRQTAVE